MVRRLQWHLRSRELIERLAENVLGKVDKGAAVLMSGLDRLSSFNHADPLDLNIWYYC